MPPMPAFDFEAVFPYLDGTLYNDPLVILALVSYQMIIAQSYFLTYPYRDCFNLHTTGSQSMLLKEENVFIM